MHNHYFISVWDNDRPPVLGTGLSRFDSCHADQPAVIPMGLINIGAYGGYSVAVSARLIVIQQVGVQLPLFTPIAYLGYQSLNQMGVDI